MNYTEVMVFVAGLLQFIVAGYALFLNRIFGTSRVGWSLVCAFSLLAFLHIIQSTMPFGIEIRAELKIEGVYALIALLMLASHLAQEQTALTQELESLKKNIERIMAMQQSYLTFSRQDDAPETAGMAETAQASGESEAQLLKFSAISPEPAGSLHAVGT